MLKWIATVLVNRLVFLFALMLILSAFTRSACYSGNGLFAPVEQAVANFRDVLQAFRQ